MNTATRPEVVSEWRDERSQMMGDDYLVEHEQSFEVDTHRETDRYVSYAAYAGVKALDVDNEAVTDEELLVKLQADSVERERKFEEIRSQPSYISGWPSKLDQWAVENPKPLRWVWDGTTEIATKDSKDDDYDNHEYDYSYSSSMFFDKKEQALTDMRYWLDGVDPIRDLSL